MQSTQELVTRIDASFASAQANRKPFLRKLSWLLAGLIVSATATTSSYGQAWKYHPKKSWEYHPRTSGKYHPKKSWKYHPTQNQRTVAVDRWSRRGFDRAAGA